MKKLLIALVASALATPAAAQVSTVGQFVKTMEICRKADRARNAMGAPEATALMNLWLKQVKAPNAVEETTGAAMCLAYMAGVAEGKTGRAVDFGQQLATEK